MKHYLIDSNVLLRLIVEPSSAHGIIAQKFFKKIEKAEAKGVISLLVVNETLWILQNYYERSKSDAVPQIIKIILLKNIDTLETSKQVIIEALSLAADKNVDFTDAYLFVNKNGHDIFSFDNDFKKLRKEKV